MKKILVIDESNLFRDFLKNKLSEFGFEVILGVNGLDGASKLRREIPDLVIMDYYLSRMSSIEVLQQKKADPNAAAIPVIMASAKVEKDKLLQVAPYNVKKFFTKPIRMDALVDAISSILGVELEIDNTPSIIDAHVNDEIMFIEIAQGLNKEKIELLRFKLTELIDLYELKNPKILVIMSSIDVGPEETIKLGALFSTIMSTTRAKPNHVKVLTACDYVRQFLDDRDDYTGVEVVGTLEHAMDGLLGRRAGSFIDRESRTVQQEFLQTSAPKSGREETIETRFHSERVQDYDLATGGDAVKVAVVDDDFVIREMVKAILSETGFQITEFENGKRFVDSGIVDDFDLVLLDLMMPEMDGFQVLERLSGDGPMRPVIILSALSQRETVVKALNHGVKSYLIKPLKPESLLNKAREILKTSF